MANKRINDLQARSDIDDTCNLAVDDASQTWRGTVAQLRAFLQASATSITDRTRDTSPAADDDLLVYDLSATALKKVAKSDLIKRAVASKSATYTAVIADHLLVCTSTFTLSLPAAATSAGKEYTIVNAGTGVITVDANASELISGATTYVLSVQYEAINIICDGTQWFIN